MTDRKASYNKDRLRLGEKLPLDTPLSVIVDVSERCNFRCNYCFRSKKQDGAWGYATKNNLMSMELFQRAVNQMSAFPQKIKVISLSGHGEPLCHPDIVSMARYLKRTAVAKRIEMHTNASMLTEKTALEIAQAGFSRIVVSLQGLDAVTYERVCGVRLDWASFYERLRLLYENRSDELKIHIKISEAALDLENLTAEEGRFYDLFGPIADTVSVEKVTPLWKNLRADTPTTINKYGQETGMIECCPILFYKMWVAPDGEIYPCTGLPAPMSLGNIQNTTLSGAWNGEQRRKFLISHLREPRGGCTECADCFVPVNTVATEEDRIDPYREEILARLEGYPHE